MAAAGRESADGRDSQSRLSHSLVMINWKNHIHFIPIKTVKSLGIISKLPCFITVSCLLTLYYSMIYPHLTCGNIVWANTAHLAPPSSDLFAAETIFSNSNEASVLFLT